MLNLLLKKGPQIFLPIEEIAGYLDPFENTICRKLDLRYLIVLDRARISYTLNTWPIRNIIVVC